MRSEKERCYSTMGQDPRHEKHDNKGLTPGPFTAASAFRGNGHRDDEVSCVIALPGTLICATAIPWSDRPREDGQAVNQAGPGPPGTLVPTHASNTHLTVPTACSSWEAVAQPGTIDVVGGSVRRLSITGHICICIVMVDRRLVTRF